MKESESGASVAAAPRDRAATGRSLVRAVVASLALSAVAAFVALAGGWPAIAAAPPTGRRALLAACALALGASAFYASRAWRLLGCAQADPAEAADQERPAAAAEPDARLAGIISSAMDAIITVDGSHRIVLYNAMAEAVFGWRADEMIGQPLDRLLPGRFRAGHQRHVETFGRTGATSRVMGRTGQLVALRRDGTEFPIEATISQVVVGADHLLTVILRDVSERVRAEHEVREANARMARYTKRLEAFQEIDRAVLGATRLDQLTMAALERLLPLVGADEADVVLTVDGADAREHRVSAGMPPVAAVLTLPEGPQRHVDAWLDRRQRRVDDLADLESLAPEPLLARRKDGLRSYLGTPLLVHGRQVGRLEVWSRAARAFDEDAIEVSREAGDQLAIAIQQALMRADLHRHAEDLEAKVAQRTLALQEVNAELNSFAYSVSHDLRTPLRSMQGFAEALLEDYGTRLDETGHDYAKRIVAASRRMDQLIQDLLTYSRLSRAELELQPVELASLLKSVAIQVEEQAQAASPERIPTIALVEPLPVVVGHRGVLSQVFQNLVSNATKFVGPDVVPTVTVSAEAQPGRVRVTVADNGIGIAPEHHDRIFRVFERLHRLDAYPGTGIGLAIVRKGVERLGGRCGVDSSLGVGSRFWVELPADDQRGVTAGGHLA